MQIFIMFEINYMDAAGYFEFYISEKDKLKRLYLFWVIKGNDRNRNTY